MQVGLGQALGSTIIGEVVFGSVPMELALEAQGDCAEAEPPDVLGCDGKFRESRGAEIVHEPIARGAAGGEVDEGVYFSAASPGKCVSRAVRASGFSQETCLRSCMASRAMGVCMRSGVATIAERTSSTSQRETMFSVAPKPPVGMAPARNVR